MKTLSQPRRTMIYQLFSSLPVVSTPQVARLFTNKQPEKRASEALTHLTNEKLIEGRRGSIGSPKVWRLTKKGREALKIDRRPVPLTSNKIPHYLAIGDCWMDLTKRGQLLHWDVELREEFTAGGKKYTYCPDAFFVIRTLSGVKPYFLEVQTSPLTSTRWAEKWAVYSAFKESPAFKSAGFQILKNKGRLMDPPIVVISSQQADTIQAGTRHKLIISPDIKKTPL